MMTTIMENLKEAGMGDIFDERVSIEHWLEDDMPTFGEIHLDEEDIVKDFDFDKYGRNLMKLKPKAIREMPE